jgi:hypothetical protein
MLRSIDDMSEDEYGQWVDDLPRDEFIEFIGITEQDIKLLARN